MNDFDYDCMQKKRTARGAFAHISRKRGGRTLPSDNLTAKQRREKNGEVKSYNITRPMPWPEFKTLPEDLKREYFRNMRSFGGTASWLADEMGASDMTIRAAAKAAGAPFARGNGNLPLWNRKVAEWANAEQQTAAETPTEEPTAQESGKRLILEHARMAKELDAEDKLPATFMVVAPGSWTDQVWDDINRMRTLNTTQSQRRQQMHVCPLQLDIVDRLINRYSNPGELVLDPFGGLGTVALEAMKAGRRGYTIELNDGYFRDAVGYLKEYEQEDMNISLFDMMGV